MIVCPFKQKEREAESAGLASYLFLFYLFLILHDLALGKALYSFELCEIL